MTGLRGLNVQGRYDEVEPHIHEFVTTLEYAVTGADVETRYEELAITGENPFTVLDAERRYASPEELVEDLLDYGE